MAKRRTQSEPPASKRAKMDEEDKDVENTGNSTNATPVVAAETASVQDATVQESNSSEPSEPTTKSRKRKQYLVKERASQKKSKDTIRDRQGTAQRNMEAILRLYLNFPANSAAFAPGYGEGKQKDLFTAISKGFKKLLTDAGSQWSQEQINAVADEIKEKNEKANEPGGRKGKRYVAVSDDEEEETAVPAADETLQEKKKREKGKDLEKRGRRNRRRDDDDNDNTAV